MMTLNRSLRNYSSYPEEQAAHEAMQTAAFKIADVLMAQKPGAFACIGGHTYWVSPFKGELEIICSPGDDALSEDWPLLVSDFDGLGADDLDQIRANFEAWLENPVFRFSDQAAMDKKVHDLYGE